MMALRVARAHNFFVFGLNKAPQKARQKILLALWRKTFAIVKLKRVKGSGTESRGTVVVQLVPRLV